MDEVSFDNDYLIIGNPNSGKSTLFNALTGLSQKTGNFQGVTVEKYSGRIYHEGKFIDVIDLPGSFNVIGSTEEKMVLTEILINQISKKKIIFVADPLFLHRSIHLLMQLIDLNLEIFIVFTMKDKINNRKIPFNISIFNKYFGTESILIDTGSKADIKLLKEQLFNTYNFKKLIKVWKFDYQIERIINKIRGKYSELTDFELLTEIKILNGEQKQSLKSKKLLPPHLVKDFKNNKFLDAEMEAKELKIKKIIEDVCGGIVKNTSLSKIDQIVLHPILGNVLFLFTFAVLFQLIFTFAEIPMNLLELLVKKINTNIKLYGGNSPIVELISDGIINGVGSVIVFIPQIALLFFFIGVIEESGYMARISFMMDKIMSKFGLSGISFIPLLSSAACAVPAILSSRTVTGKKERLITILVSPLITCSARYPVYILVISAIFPVKKFYDLIELKGLVLFALFFLGMITSLLVALVLSKVLKIEQKSVFIVEFPEYRVPKIKSLVYLVYKKIISFLQTSGKIILLASIILWFLANYPKDKNTKNQGTQINQSYAGRFGKLIEPAIEPIGFDWKIGISLLTSFAAREVAVSTLAIIYGVNEENQDDLGKAMKADMNPKTEKPVWGFVNSICFLIFFAYSCQCISTLSVIRKETNSYKWPVFVFTYMTILAYLSTLIVYKLWG